MIRTIFIAAAALAASLTVGLVSAPPAYAADELCETMPAEIRAAVQGADDRSARRALAKADIGAALCEAGNERAAKKKFAEAVKALDLDPKQFAMR